MRADQHTLITLDAYVQIPDRDFLGDIALFPLSSACWISPIHWQATYRKLVPFAGQHRCGHLLHKFGRALRNGMVDFALAAYLVRDLDFVERLHSLVYSREVTAHYGFSAFAVGLLDRIFDSIYSLLDGKYTRDSKKAGLHYGIDATTHTRCASDAGRIDGIETNLFSNEVLLNYTWQTVPYMLFTNRCIKQEGSTLHSLIQHIETIQKHGLMAGDEISLLDQIGRANGLVPKTQVRYSHGTRFF